MRNRVRGSQDPRAGELPATVYHQKLTTWEVVVVRCSHPASWKQGDFGMILPKNPGACFFFLFFGFFLLTEMIGTYLLLKWGGKKPPSTAAP